MNKIKTLHFFLLAVAPFRLDLTIWALKRRSRNIVDYWNGTQYVRVFPFENIPVKVQLEQNGKDSHILVTARSHSPIHDLQFKLSHLINEMLGLNINLKRFYNLTKGDSNLHSLVLRFRGVKPTRFPTLFEAFANAIACQQISLEAGLSILNKFIQRYGISFKDEEGTFYAFPEPAEIMKCKDEDLMSLGFSQHKSETLRQLASEILSHEEMFRHLEQLSNQEIVTQLCQFKGMGRWSAEYVLLRGLGRLEVLPGDDVAVQKAIQKIFHLKQKPLYEKIKEIEQTWNPFAGMIYFHLVLQKLSETGDLSPVPLPLPLPLPN